MLLSELEERERRFKLALRAGIPVILLISLVFYSVIFREEHFVLTLETAVLFGGLLFITVYFIYFLMELSVKESLIDQTTQGFNERAFVAKLEKYHPKTLVLLIVRNLSSINENYSAEEVDTLLYTIIHTLNDTLKEAGLSRALIARRYGAEFLIAIDQEYEHTEKLFQQFIDTHQQIGQIEVDYTFAVMTNISTDIAQDIRHLKNLVSMQEKRQKQQTAVVDAQAFSDMEESILTALKQKRFTLNFRPLRNTKSNLIDIYEVTVKLRSDTQGEILPKTYLPVINRLGRGREYDMALYEHILTLLPLIDERISLSFNLSPFSLRDAAFQKTFFQKLTATDIDTKRLIIELYERRTHHNLSGYLKTLDRFRANGVRIAIDNFGSSSASMEYMKHFRFDIVQFDRDYVTKLDDTNTRAMLHSLIQMAKELHITTVAKWVDRPEQEEMLIKMGIDYLQGFGIAKMINERELIDRYN
jgi:EAL domain-containing protein (putative c-di-GMP-specific phosphodiesterase class I)